MVGRMPRGWNAVCGVQWEEVEYHLCYLATPHNIHVCGDEDCDYTVEDKRVRRDKYIRKYRD